MSYFYYNFADINPLDFVDPLDQDVPSNVTSEPMNGTDIQTTTTTTTTTTSTVVETTATHVTLKPQQLQINWITTSVSILLLLIGLVGNIATASFSKRRGYAFSLAVVNGLFLLTFPLFLFDTLWTSGDVAPSQNACLAQDVVLFIDHLCTVVFVTAIVTGTWKHLRCGVSEYVVSSATWIAGLVIVCLIVVCQKMVSQRMAALTYVLLSVGSFIGCFMVIALCCSAKCLKLCRTRTGNKKMAKGLSVRDRSDDQLSEGRSGRFAACLAGWALICFSAFHVFQLIEFRNAYQKGIFYERSHDYTFFLAYINAAFNPYFSIVDRSRLKRNEGQTIPTSSV